MDPPLSTLKDPNKIFKKQTPSAVENSLTCLRMKHVVGYIDVVESNHRVNDIIYVRPDTELCVNSVVVYFGGDIQDFSEDMKKNIYSSKYLDWSLENTSQLLHKCFPDNHIVVVHPCRASYGVFSRYETFVPVDKYGTPKHIRMFNALHHLEALLRNVSRIIKESYIKEEEGFPELQNSDIILIGFSKGCVVLNQFLYEFHCIETLHSDDKSLSRFIPQIKEMYWLDGGHSGHSNTWITSPSILETLANLDIKIHVHVTPYQVHDSKKPWVGSEEHKFSSLLKELNADIERILHFEDRAVSLEMHFELLTVFRQAPQIQETSVD